MSRKTKVVLEDAIELSANDAEKGMEPSQSLAKQLAGNARSRLTEIIREQTGLEQTIATKQVQCEDLENAADQSEDDYQRALRHLQHIQSRLAKERVKAQVATGTPAEQESLAALASLQEDLDSAL